MPEQEQQPKKKKAGIVRRIFKWIFIVLLGLLLIAGIYFQAPWKVLTLLAIILAALTILPKPARKYFWAGVGVVVIALVVWVFLPENNEGWRPFTFDKELAELEAARAIPDSENAAIIYEELFANYDGYIFVRPKLQAVDVKDINVAEYMKLAEEARPEDTFYPDFWNDELDSLTLSQPWSTKDHPKVAEWLQDKHQSTITDLVRACQKDACRFPIKTDPGDLEQMNRSSAMRRWARLLIRAGNNDLGDSRIDQALGKYLCAFQMAKHQYQQPTIIDFLVGFAIEGLAIRQFNQFVVTGDATQEHLNIVEEALAGIKHDWSSDLRLNIDSEKLLMKNLWAICYEVNPEGKTRLSRDPTAGVKAELPEEIPTLTYWRKKLLKAYTILGWFIMPSTPQKAGKIIDDAYERLYAMAKPDFDWEKGPKEYKFSLTSVEFNFRYMIDMLLYILEPAYCRIHDVYLRTISQQRASQLIIALRRYKNQTGQWPESLDEIQSLAPAEVFVDAINGDSFAYKLTEENFTLYSKGKNNIDEDGKRDRSSDEEGGADDFVFWPWKRCKDKEESANDKQ